MIKQYFTIRFTRLHAFPTSPGVPPRVAFLAARLFDAVFCERQLPVQLPMARIYVRPLADEGARGEGERRSRANRRVRRPPWHSNDRFSACSEAKARRRSALPHLPREFPLAAELERNERIPRGRTECRESVITVPNGPPPPLSHRRRASAKRSMAIWRLATLNGLAPILIQQRKRRTSAIYPRHSPSSEPTSPRAFSRAALIWEVVESERRRRASALRALRNDEILKSGQNSEALC